MEEIINQLLVGRQGIKDAVPPAGAGIYAFYLASAGALGEFSGNEGAPIYLGRSSNLAGRHMRQHLRTGGTGTSTLRRSLGAILKDELKLTSIHRGAGQNPHDFINYRFTNEDEIKVTEWMVKNLDVAYVLCPDHQVIEPQLLATCTPPLNIQGNNNPLVPRLLELRSACAAEALANN